MATDDTVTVITSPRIDRKWVDAQGNLTQNAYALLYGLIRRTGGTSAPMIDVNDIYAAIDAAGAVQINAPAFPDVSFLAADIVQPAARQDCQWPDVMQAGSQDPTAFETTWQR